MTGASEYSFVRLFKILDELCEEGVIDKDKLIVQTGKDQYISCNYKTFDMVSNKEFNDLSDKADFIISHAGTGCVVPNLKKGKRIIVFPRLEKYNEHLDDHQLELADLFSKEGYVICAKNKKELINAIRNINDFSPKKFISNVSKINQIIVDFIES